MRPTMRHKDQLGRVLIVLLGLLLAVFMTVEIAHSHSTEAGAITGAAHCQICATAHVASASEPAWLTGFVLLLLGTVILGEPSPGLRPVLHALFIRPPPAPDSPHA